MSQKPYKGMMVHWFNQADRGHGCIPAIVTGIGPDGTTVEVAIVKPLAPMLTHKRVVLHMADARMSQDPRPEYIKDNGGWDFIPELSANHDIAALSARVSALVSRVAELSGKPEKVEKPPKQPYKMKTAHDATPEEVAKVLALAEKYSEPYDVKKHMGVRWPLAAVEAILIEHGKLQPVGSN